MMIERPRWDAGSGLDATTGLGVPNGAKLAAAIGGTVVTPPPPGNGNPPPPPPVATPGPTLAQVKAAVDPVLAAVIRDFSSHRMLRMAASKLAAAKAKIDVDLAALPWPVPSAADQTADIP